MSNLAISLGMQGVDPAGGFPKSFEMSQSKCLTDGQCSILYDNVKEDI